MAPDVKQKYEKMAKQAKKQTADLEQVPVYPSARAATLYTSQGVPLPVLVAEQQKILNEKEILNQKIAKRLEDSHCLGGKFVKFTIFM